MADLTVNKPELIQPQKHGFQKASANSGLDKINNAVINNELYSDFLNWKKTQPTKNNQADAGLEDKKSNKNKKIILSIAGGVIFLLGGAGVILGRKSILNLREKLNQSIELLQNLKDSRHLKALDNAKLATIKFINKALGYTFSFDKTKDFALLNMFESLGKPGKFIVKASKSSLYITENTTLPALYQSLKMNVNSVSKAVKKALTSPEGFSNPQEKQLIEKLDVLINGNNETKGLTAFSEDLISGLKERTNELKDTIQKVNIKKYREKYFPSGFNSVEFKRVVNNWKENLFSGRENKDVLRENWSETEKILMSNIDKTGAKDGKPYDLGQARIQLDNITKAMEEICQKPDCSDEFINLTRQVNSLNQKINNPKSATNPITFETSSEKYAGRVLDLSAGGGMSEILIPPVTAGLITYKTFNDSKSGERKEKFMRSGGPELIGGLAGWMITANLLSVSGATGMLVGLTTAGIINILNKRYLKHLEKTRKTPDNKN